MPQTMFMMHQTNMLPIKLSKIAMGENKIALVILEGIYDVELWDAHFIALHVLDLRFIHA